MFITAIFTIAKLWKQPRCPTTDKWIKKMCYLYTMEFYAAMKKNEIRWLMYSLYKYGNGQIGTSGKGEMAERVVGG
jgi:hypothetical protein